MNFLSGFKKKPFFYFHSICNNVGFFFQIAEGMTYMEKEKFVHRNLGARNILVGDGNNVKIAGFGMTKVVDDPDFNFRRGKSSNARKLSSKH